MRRRLEVVGQFPGKTVALALFRAVWEPERLRWRGVKEWMKASCELSLGPESEVPTEEIDLSVSNAYEETA